MSKESGNIPQDLERLFTRQSQESKELLSRKEAEAIVEYATPLALGTVLDTLPDLSHVVKSPGEVLLNTSRGRGPDYRNIVTIRWGEALSTIRRLENDFSLEVFPPTNIKGFLQRLKRPAPQEPPSYQRVALHITSSGLDLRFSENPLNDDETEAPYLGILDFVRDPTLLPPLLEKATLSPLITPGLPFRRESPKVISFVNYGITQALWTSNGEIIRIENEEGK